jgi:CubicO group peptidase (beta-lactamase class C family)
MKKLSLPQASAILVISLLHLLWFTASRAQTYPIHFDSLKAKIDSIAIKYHVPGAQVVVFTSDSVLFKQNVGVKNLKTKEPVTDETMFRLGSITKSFVAVSALQLIEKGDLKLEDQLKELAPEIQFKNPWEETHPVRIVHLLEHTTGFDDWALKEYAFSSDTITLEQGLMLYPESRTSRWRPGSFFAYCNSGPPIVARIIEKKTGQEYESWVRTNIFDPLGMKSITFRNDGAALQHLVTNYSGEQNPKEEKYWSILRRPAGSLNASALELMPFVQMLMKRGTYQGIKMLDSASVDRMERPVTTLAAEAGSMEGYGLHNYTTSYKGYLFHGHDGGVNGGLAHYVYNAPLNIGFVVLVNYGGQGFTKLNDAVMKTIMEPVPSAVPESVSLTGDEIAKWKGYYRAAYPRASMTYFLEWLLGIVQVYERDGQLYNKDLLGGEETPLHHSKGNQFMNLNKEGYTNTFTFTDNDEHETVMIAGFANTRKTSAIGAWIPVALGAVTLFFTLLGLLAGIIWIIRYFYLRSHGRSLSAFPARMSFWAYCLSFISMTLLIILNFEGFSLGNPGGASWAVFVSSILILIFALLAIYLFVRDRQQVKSRADRLYLYACLGSALIITTYLGVWGMIGIRTWI